MYTLLMDASSSICWLPALNGVMWRSGGVRILISIGHHHAQLMTSRRYGHPCLRTPTPTCPSPERLLYVFFIIVGGRLRLLFLVLPCQSSTFDRLDANLFEDLLPFPISSFQAECWLGGCHCSSIAILMDHPAGRWPYHNNRSQLRANVSISLLLPRHVRLLSRGGCETCGARLMPLFCGLLSWTEPFPFACDFGLVGTMLIYVAVNWVGFRVPCLVDKAALGNEGRVVKI